MEIALVVGALLILLGLWLIRLHKLGSNQLLDIRYNKRSSAKDLVDLQENVSAEIGVGAFSQLAEVVGKVEDTSPINAEISNDLCVWYSVSVTERYEEERTESDGQGGMRIQIRTANRNVAKNERFVKFGLTDQSGSVRIDPDKARVEGIVSVDQYEPIESATSVSSRISKLIGSRPNDRVLGYHYSETIIPVGTELYVLGEATDRSGVLQIESPSDKQVPFIISVKSEEEVAAQLGKSLILKKWLGIGALIVGLGVLVAAGAGLFNQH